MVMDNFIGKKIKHKRKILKLSLQDLADRAGVSKGYIYQIEEGRSDATVKTIKSIANYLEVPTMYLIEDSLNIGSYPDTDKEIRNLEKWQDARLRMASEVINDIFNEKMNTLTKENE